MKILVIDDIQENLETALIQLGNIHEVTTVSSYDEAERYIAGNLPHVSANGRWGHIGYEEEGRYDLKKHHFDVILTDLFLPASQRAAVSNPSLGEEPLGLIIAMAALRMDIPVAIVSRGGHHHNPFLWAMDLLAPNSTGGNPYLIGNTPFTFSNDPGYYKNAKNDYVDGKDWNQALDNLLSIMEKSK